MCEWSDAVFVRYVIGLVISLYGAGLFTWWWIKNGKASFVFMCVTILFMGDSIEKVIQIYGRYLRLVTGSVVFSEHSVWWIIKGDLSMLASLIVVIYLTMRATGHIAPPPALICPKCGRLCERGKK